MDKDGWLRTITGASWKRVGYDEGVKAGREGAEIWHNPHVSGSGNPFAAEGWFAGWAYGKQLQEGFSAATPPQS